MTGVVLDVAPSAATVRLDWVSGGTNTKTGDTVSVDISAQLLLTVGARVLISEVGEPKCRGLKDGGYCPVYGFRRELDGGNVSCDVLVSERKITLTEQQSLDLIARSDCYENLKAQLGLAGQDLCKGQERVGCDACTTPSRQTSAPGGNLSVVTGGAFATMILFRLLSRRKRRSPVRSRSR